MEIVSGLVTGGPCSGKTQGFAFLKKELKNLGITAVLAPEVATPMILAGPHPQYMPEDEMVEWQNVSLQIQLAQERDFYRRIAEIAGRLAKTDRVLLLHDRGALDNGVYMPRPRFNEILARNGLTWVTAREGLYDFVIHMVTAAHGAETFYNNDNEARTETPEEARNFCDLTRDIYVGHPKQIIIDNSTDFPTKKQRLLKAVLHGFGHPAPLEIERKFMLMKRPDPTAFPVLSVPVEIHQSYLNDERMTRIRSRAQKGEGVLYYLTQKFQTDSAMSEVERESRISAPDYLEAFFNQRHQDHEEIIKIRHNFIWKSQHFELDFFQSPWELAGLTLLEAELISETDPVEVPLWLGDYTEVTGDKKFKNINLSRKRTASM